MILVRALCGAVRTNFTSGTNNVLIITTVGKRNHQYVVKLAASDDVCFFLIQQCQSIGTWAWLLLFNLLKPNSLKCPGFVWEPLFASGSKQIQNTNIQKYLASSNLSPNGMQRFTKCMEKFLQFSVSLVVAWMPDLKQDAEFFMIFSIVKCTGNN